MMDYGEAKKRLLWLLNDMLCRLDSSIEAVGYGDIDVRFEEAGDCAATLGFAYPPIQQWHYPYGYEFYVVPGFGEWLPPPQGIEVESRECDRFLHAKGYRLHDPTSQGAARGGTRAPHKDICVGRVYGPRGEFPDTIRSVLSHTDRDAVRHCLSAWLREVGAFPEAEATKAGTSLGGEDQLKKRTPRPTRDEYNIRAREYLKAYPLAKSRELSSAIGCALGTVSKLPAWQAVREARRKGRIPKCIALTEKFEATVGEDDAALRRLMNEQETDRRETRHGYEDDDDAPEHRFTPRRKP